MSTVVEACTGKGFQHTTDNPLAVRKSAEVSVRQATPFDERQTGNFRPPLGSGSLPTFSPWNVISAAPVVDSKNTRVCSPDRMSASTMPIFKMVMERGVRVWCTHNLSFPACQMKNWTNSLQQLLRPNGARSLCSFLGCARHITCGRLGSALLFFSLWWLVPLFGVALVSICSLVFRRDWTAP